MFSESLPIRQTIAAIAMSVTMLVVVVELVRKRKLREEYSFLWVGTALLLLVMAFWNDVLVWFQRLLGAEAPASALWFGAIVFLMLVALQFSIRISKIAFREKAMAQRVALLEKDIDDLKKQLGTREKLSGPSDSPARQPKSDAAGER